MSETNGQGAEFQPIAVGVHEGRDFLPIPPTGRLTSIAVLDDCTEDGKPVVLITVIYEGEQVQSLISLSMFLQTIRLIMDSYVEEVRATFGI